MAQKAAITIGSAVARTKTPGEKHKYKSRPHNGPNNNWFGGPTDNSGANGTGTRKGKMSKANETNNNWFAPSNGTRE